MTGRAALPYWLAAPGALLVIGLVALPLVMTLSLSLYSLLPDGGIGPDLSLTNYAQVLTDNYYQSIFARTFGLAAVVTGICILVGVPEAYVIHRLPGSWRAVSILVVLGPLLVSVVVRSLGWAILLGSDGLINTGLLALHLVDQPLKLMFSFSGLVIALVHVLVPYMVLTVWASLQKLDPAGEQAAESLGAGAATVMRKIVLPQLVPGILSGGLIVFALAASAFATPSIIGGRRLKVVPTAIYDQFLSALDWPLGAALAATLVAAVLAVSVLVNRLVERRYWQVFL